MKLIEIIVFEAPTKCDDCEYMTIDYEMQLCECPLIRNEFGRVTVNGNKRHKDCPINKRLSGDALIAFEEVLKRVGKDSTNKPNRK